MASYTGLDLFPGVSLLGHANEQVREMLTTFDVTALAAFHKSPPRSIEWASAIAKHAPAEFRAKIPVDFTALDGFQPINGERKFKDVDLTATTIDVQAFERNIAWSTKLAKVEGLANVSTQSANLIDHARRHYAYVVATVFMQGTPSTAKALTYKQPGAVNGLSLFNTAHYVNPLVDSMGTFSNYYPVAGKFNPTSYGVTRTNMQYVPSPTGGATTTGYEVTHIIGPSHMDEPFRQTRLSQLFLQPGTGAAAVSAAAPSNIYHESITPCEFWIAPQLNGDPYLEAYKVANPSWTPSTLPHLWIAITTQVEGVRPVAVAAPSGNGMPVLTVMGEGSEWSVLNRKIGILADLDIGAAAYLPHGVARYEET